MVVLPKESLVFKHSPEETAREIPKQRKKLPLIHQFLQAMKRHGSCEQEYSKPEILKQNPIKMQAGEAADCADCHALQRHAVW